MTMVSRRELVNYLDNLLRLDDIPGDVSNNGLQVEGSDGVNKAVFAVDASLQLFEAAAAEHADFIFVHHGISWKDSLKYLTGVNASRCRALFRNDISLYACHLPLDCHPELGHNALIADALGLRERGTFYTYAGVPIGWYGTLPTPLPLEQLEAEVNSRWNTVARVLAAGRPTVRTTGIVSGGGDGAIPDCQRLGLDCLITGELSHENVHLAHEAGINVVAGGHYCTEVPGVQRVMEQVQRDYGLDSVFIDLPTGY